MQNILYIDIYDIIEYSKNIDYSNYGKHDAGMRDTVVNSVWVISAGKINKIYSSGDWNMYSNDENAQNIKNNRTIYIRFNLIKTIEKEEEQIKSE